MNLDSLWRKTILLLASLTILSVFFFQFKSGQRFKYATYRYLNRMFRDEDYPDESVVTWLTKIWKKKGSQARLKDNGFVHSKEPFAKLLEKCMWR